MLSSSFRRASVALRIPVRSFASGPNTGGEISDELLQRLGSLSTQALVDGLWVMGWPNAQINGTRALSSTMKCVGRAVTLKFVPARPDIAQDKPPGGASPEYEAFELCGPNEVSLLTESTSERVLCSDKNSPLPPILGSLYGVCRTMGVGWR
jgi:hypothetical protein